MNALYDLINIQAKDIPGPKLGDSYNEWWRTKYVPAWFSICRTQFELFKEQKLYLTAAALQSIMWQQAKDIGYDLNIGEFIK